MPRLHVTTSLQIADYDFIDFGASTGGSMDFAVRKLGGTRGLGVDLAPDKVATMRARGLDCIEGDITALDLPDKCVRFVTISHVLEHLPDLATVAGAIESAVRLASDFVFIQGPWYDANDYLETLGLKLYWADWPRGHTCHVNSTQLRAAIERQAVSDYYIAGRGVIPDSSHVAVHPVDSPPNQHAYDSDKHPPKPVVPFSRPVFEEMVSVVKLRPDLEEWEALTRARGATTMVVAPQSVPAPGRRRGAPGGAAIGRRTAVSPRPKPARRAYAAGPPISREQNRKLTKLRHRLLHSRKLSYVRYLHMREGLLLAPGIESVLSVGSGRGLAELALAVEFPSVSFDIAQSLPHVERGSTAQAEAVSREWELSNVRFTTRDLLRPERRQHDMVMCVELLELLDDHERAAAEARAAAREWVFALAPFATPEVSARKDLQAQLLESHGRHRVGYDDGALAAMFPGVVALRGCFWKEAGGLLQTRLADLSDDEIAASAKQLQKQAEDDLLDAVPLSRQEAQGLWLLSQV